MKRTIFNLVFSALFLSATSAFARGGLALIGPSGNVALFYREGSLVLVKNCEPNSLVNGRFDCVQKKNSRVAKATLPELRAAFRFLAKLNGEKYSPELRRKLELYSRGKLLDGSELARSKAETSEELRRIEAFIAAHGAENADLKRKEELERSLQRLNQQIEDNTEAALQQANRDVSQLVDRLIERITDSATTGKVSYSEQKTGFEYNILKELADSPDLVASFVSISPGTFLMGSPATESKRDEDEVLHRVTLTRGFEMQVTEVTQGQFALVMGTNPSITKIPMWCQEQFASSLSIGGICLNNPVEAVSWADAQAYIAKLNALDDGYVYRLPTAAEWEYSARAGTQTPYYYGENPAELRDYAWYLDNSGSHTRAVGSKKPNAFGLYDMYGNVAEWVQDWYGPYSAGDAVDPKGPDVSVSKKREARGGGAQSVPRYQRSATRIPQTEDSKMDVLGFRLVRTPK